MSRDRLAYFGVTCRMLVFISVLSATSVHAARFGGIEEISVHVAPEYFTWSEYGSGRRILKESGILYDTGSLIILDMLQTEASGDLMLKVKTDLFGGQVSYDGETSELVPKKVKTDVDYFGLRLDVDGGWRITNGGFAFTPFAGAGVRWWLRGLQDSTLPDGTVASGYTEGWGTAFARAGIRNSFRITQDLALHMEAGGKYPFYTTNKPDFTNATLKPEGALSGFGEIGARYGKLRLAAYYEGFRYKKSPPVTVGVDSMGRPNQIYQPESRSDIMGLRLEWAFK